MKTLIIIPSRLAATRLPGKPLLKIEGISIISHVFKRAESANIGEVIVATEDREIIDDVKSNGGNAILTSKNHKTGTDRIHEAFKKLQRNDINYIMNIQGDEPEIDINDIKNLDDKMKANNSKIGTLAAKISSNEVYKNKNIVKVKVKGKLDRNLFPFAEDFIRITKNKENIYHHLGIYCYETETLNKFISFDQSKNELKHSLEQLRALDNNININVGLANSSSIGVDTEEDYLAIKKIMEYK
jgi:3-deoxy-manno-octulosonate cytidylyltransferase (CMP-KDO synthetase)